MASCTLVAEQPDHRV